MNKEEIKKQLKEEMNKQIDEFVDTLSDELAKEKFNMSNVENAIGSSLNNYQTNIMNTTERLFNSRLETDLISKKKRMGRKRI